MPDAEPEYIRYLKLSNFDSGPAGIIMDILIATGRKKPGAHDIWLELRNMANFGLCDCARMRNQPDVGIRYCKVALTFDKQDLFSHYALGELLIMKYYDSGGTALLAEARQHFAKVITLNSDIDEAPKARKYISDIDVILARLK